MVTREEALRRAREWLSGGTHEDALAPLDVFEFDLGYVVWPVRPAGEAGRPPAVIGGARAVVDRETGELTTWPMLPAPVIAEQYREARRSRERFPPEVHSDLLAAGWWPGRDVAAAVDQWLDRTGIDRELPMFDAARRALDEFGGLDIPQRGPSGKPGVGFTSRLYPRKLGPTTPEIHEFVEIIGRPVFPIGGNDNGPGHLVIDVDGRVYLLGPFDDYLVGDTFDAALAWMTRYHKLPSV